MSKIKICQSMHMVVVTFYCATDVGIFIATVNNPILTRINSDHFKTSFRIIFAGNSEKHITR